MIRACVLAVLAGLPVTACAEPPAPGIYGNVQLSGESGDLGGAELELIGSGPGARVEFVICEGWCNSVTEAPVSFTEDGFTFGFVERWYDQDGALAVVRPYDAKVTRNGEGITLTVVPAEAPDQAFSHDLPRIEDRFGLAVAAGED